MKSAGDAGTSASEVQAVKLEAELIAAYGTEDTGGLLTNSVVPSGVVHKVRPEVVVGARLTLSIALPCRWRRIVRATQVWGITS